MEYLRFLKEQSSALGVRFIAIAVLAGITNGILVGVIISSGGTAHESSEQFRKFILFLLSLLLFILTRKHILDRTSEMVEGVIRKVRVQISETLQRTELPAFESIGKARIMQSLSQDAQSMSEGAYSITSGFASAILVTCAFLYIAMLSLSACLMIAGLLVAGVFVYLRNYNTARQTLDASWQAENQFFDLLSDQLDGFNELKINHEKATDLLENDLKATALRSEELKLKITRQFNGNMIFGQSYFYIVMAFTIFVLPNLSTDADLPVSQILAVILFITGPLGDVIAAAPILAKANFATKKIQSLQTELRALSDELPEADELAQSFESLRCEGLVYRYPRVEGQREFQVGPLDLEIRRGEILFLVGGNGTGKSTFLKLLCGLLPQTEGTILLNGRPITRSRLSRYRSYFSIILQDFRLFRRLLGVKKIDHGRVDELLALLQMTKVASIDANGRFSSTKLSTGQKKRLALLVVELDEREIYLFDEWAADQDPEFRKYFYESYLQNLRVRGKTIIAATHDDHYFHLADRILKMEDGKLASVTNRGADQQ